VSEIFNKRRANRGNFVEAGIFDTVVVFSILAMKSLNRREINA